MRQITYRDDNSFYRELFEALKSGETIVLSTPFKSMDEVPQRLKDAFELAGNRDRPWVNVKTGLFVAGTAPSLATAVGMNYRPIVVIGSTVAGAAIGAGVGAVAGAGGGALPGAGVGAVVGLAAGTVAAAQMDGSHETEVEIDKNGRLKIHIKPRKPA